MTDDRFNFVAAVTAASNLIWMPTVHESLQIVLTLLGILYMGLQIYYRIKKGE